MNITDQIDTITQFTLKLGINLVPKYGLEKELRLLQCLAYDGYFIPASLD